MTMWKTGAAAGALVLAAGVGAALAPAAHAQARDREPLARAFQILGGGPQIGVTVHDPERGDKAAGVVVDEVQDGSPADTAGIKEGDAIVEFDGERVRSVRQLQRLVRETADGRTVPAVVVRNDQRVTVSVEPEREAWRGLEDEFPLVARMARTPEPPRAIGAPRPPRVGRFMPRSRDGRLGVTVEPLSDQLEDYFGVKEGVLVRSVREDSAAAKAGVKAGDIVVALNGHHITDPSDLAREVSRAGDGDVRLEIVRDRKGQTLTVKLDAGTRRSRTRARRTA